MAQLRLNPDLFKNKLLKKQTQARSASNFEEHFATLLAIRGYFDLLDFDSLEQTKAGVFVFRSDSKSIKALPFSKRGRDIPISFDEFDKQLEQLWTPIRKKTKADYEYWLVLDANLNAFSEKFDTNQSSLEYFQGENGKNPLTQKTTVVVEPDPQSEATNLIANQLNLDIISADIIRHQISKLILEQANDTNLTIFNKSRPISKVRIDRIIREITMTSVGYRTGISSNAPSISPLTFPSVQSNLPYIMGFNIKPQHLSSSKFIYRPKPVNQIIQNLKRCGASLITEVDGQGSSALLWNVAKKTSIHRCWFNVDASACLDEVTIPKLIRTYPHNYPIGFVLDNINLSNYRVFLSMLDEAEKNDNVWIFGTASYNNRYLVTCHQSLSVYYLRLDEDFNNKRIETAAEIISESDKDRKKIEKIMKEKDSDMDSAVTHGRYIINQTQDNILLEYYANTDRAKNLESLPKSASFRMGKKSRKHKFRKGSNLKPEKQVAHEPETNIKIDQSELQERTAELDVLIATAYTIALEGSISIDTLESNLKLDSKELIATIDRLQTRNFLLKDEKNNKVYGVHSLSCIDRCSVLVDIDFATWNEMVASAIEISDSSLLEVLTAEAVFLERINSFELSNAIRNRFEKRKVRLANSSQSSANSPPNQEDGDNINRDFEDWIRLARGVFHGHLLKITEPWTKSCKFPDILTKSCISAATYAISGRVVRTQIGSEFPNIDARGKAWFQKIRNVKLPQIVVSNIVTLLNDHFEQLNPHLISEAMMSLQGYRLDKTNFNLLCDMDSAVAKRFVSMDINDVMRILDLAYCLDVQLFDRWVEAYRVLEGRDSLTKRVIANIPHSEPLLDKPKDSEKELEALIYRDILSVPNLDVQSLLNQYSNSLMLLYEKKLDVTTFIVDDFKNKVDSAPFGLAFTSECTIERVRFALHTGIAVAKFAGAPCWSAYLEAGTNLLETLYSYCLTYLNRVCLGLDADNVLSELCPTFVNGIELPAPINLSRYILHDAFDEQPLQSLAMSFNQAFFKGFRELPNNSMINYLHVTRLRSLSERVHEEPWKLISHSPPAILQKLQKLFKNLTIVNLVASNINMHPAEKWKVPTALSDSAFSYIVAKCRKELTSDQLMQLLF